MRARLFAHAFSTEARKWMSYRADFWLTAVVGFFANFGVVYCLWRAIYQASPGASFGGYDFDGIVLYSVLAILLGRLVRGADRVADIAQDIYDGSLSRYIVYPTSYFGFKYAQHLGQLVPACAQLLLFGVVYGGFLPFPANVTIGVGSCAMAAVSVMLGNMLFYALSAPLQAVAFWADNVWSLVVMMRVSTALFGGAMLPLALFPEWGQRLLTWLPFRFLYDFPITVLMGKVPFEAWLQGSALGLAWVAAIAGLTRVVWRRGMLVYSGVGI